MIVEPHRNADNRDHFGCERPILRVIAPGLRSLQGGSSWHVVPRTAGIEADCWLVDTDDMAHVSVDEILVSRLPLVLIAAAGVVIADAWLEAADGFVLPADDDAVVAAVLAQVMRPTRDFIVADLSDGTARTINALSIEASRIAEQLMLLAAAERANFAAPARGVDAALVRRLIKLRRDRERYFPAEIFADPAWDMLLDLMAARLEGKQVPVSSLCIAAAVPTTTALRWVRSLTEAGLLERRTDPSDARRSHVELTAPAVSAMLGYLRGFAEAFALR